MFIGKKSFLLTKSNEELKRLGTINKNYQQNLLLAKPKLLHFSDPFGMTEPFGIRLVKSNLPSSCIILYGPYFFRL